MDIQSESTLSSFITDANNSAFSLYNLPYGVFASNGNQNSRIAVRIGDYALDLSELEKVGLLGDAKSPYFINQPNLNHFAQLGSAKWMQVRNRLQSLLSATNTELQHQDALLKSVLFNCSEITMRLPFAVGAFTDFYAAENHATNVGKLFRGNENPLLPNWKYLPVAYNGRASTVFVSGKTITRPQGQIKTNAESPPIFGPTKKLDFELEMGMIVGVGNPDGSPIALADCREHVFGLVLLNDWSARDIQAFEYQPLGPFLAKSFATTVSPWVVPMAAIADSMVELQEQNPKPVAYLQQKRYQPNIDLCVEIKPRNSTKTTIICETNSRELYWTMEQMLAHHTINNCIMNTGDLLGTGTISGEKPSSWGSLLERTFNGTQPLHLAENIQRHFIEDGDEIIITGYCLSKNGKIGFGSLKNRVKF